MADELSDACDALDRHIWAPRSILGYAFRTRWIASNVIEVEYWGVSESPQQWMPLTTCGKGPDWDTNFGAIRSTLHPRERVPDEELTGIDWVQEV